MKTIRISARLLFLYLIFTPALAQEKLSYPDLIERLYDFEYLATPPHLGERSGNFSSYDRKSKYNPELDTYENWNANRDGTGFIRKEEDNQVIFEKKGPGVIW